MDRKKTSYLLLTLMVLGVSYFGVRAISDTKKDKLSYALELANDNRKELEFAINYFDKQNDSLKKQAVIYLIENMIEHYSSADVTLLGDGHTQALELFTHANEKYLRLKINREKQNKSVWKNFRIAKKTLDSLVTNFDIKASDYVNSDLRIIKGQWLIDHVERAFQNWNTSKLLPQDGFDEFCETFLPYRYLDEQPIMPKEYPNKLFKNLLKNTDLQDTQKVIDTINSYFEVVNRLTKGIEHESDLGFYNILKWTSLSCYEQVAISTKILNDIGIPTRIDYTPVFFHRDEGHSWCVVKDASGMYRPFSPWWQNIEPYTGKSPYRKNYYKRVPKVYRKSFIVIENSLINLKHNKEQIHHNFDGLFDTDVTDEYHDVTDINVPLDQFLENTNILYLSMFNYNSWKTIGWGIVNKNEKHVNFKKVPKGYVFSVSSYKNKKTHRLSQAFYIDNHNTLQWVKPSHSTIAEMQLFEKYPEKERIIEYRQDLIGGRFEVSNDKNFEHAKTIYTFDSLPKNYVTQIDLNVKGKYQYFRFKPEKRVQAGLSVLECYSKVANGNTMVKGTPAYVFLKPLLNAEDSETLSRLDGVFLSAKTKASKERLRLPFDSNLETYAKDYWIGLDFGSPEQIDAIRYATRSANNRIAIGDTYELLYYDKGWVSFGTKKAEYNAIDFNDVPSGTMYWLRNKTRGKEELPFFYSNGKQYFVNYDAVDISKLL